ncbi:peptidoglycan-associated lipoprotein Pal [Asticcacaulis sp. EMRT-3]|uniref:peptidoglycan-associated lipoprotein Pal n=1 Tax=Asticcacaulis sp. EMRT-3 TaxID=3040349 RepID=UPI0024AF3A33|nr:peptidoglycan-associated lipoprotein Pal [Asticcacaulis sp. EMRT-3]MDI7775281.1 peptidoglycan-associated lipoprotein Pal [Asticcacaulis sp. EMRT-3]
MLVSTKPVVRIAAAAFILASVAACASKPKPVETAPPPVAEQAPPPAPPPPAPQPVTQAPLPGIVPGSQQDFVVNVGDRVYFDTNHSDIRSDAQSILAAQAAWLVRYPSVNIRIEGNCDDRGTREYNFALGARRAQSVADFLTAHGVVPARISTISYGKEQPIDPGDDEAAWAKNRNAHTTLVSGAQ